jgi:hypothetical protein
MKMFLLGALSPSSIFSPLMPSNPLRLSEFRHSKMTTLVTA